MTKREIIKQVTKIILKHAKPERIYLYGSQANGEALPTSDIDIAFMDEDFKNIAAIKEEVDGLATLVKIDVTNLKYTEERFRNRVMSTGTVLYSASKQLRAEDGLHNLTMAFERFDSAVKRKKELYDDGYSDIFLDLVVKRFEFTFEMSWKAIKRFLDFIGIGCTSPRGCYKEAFSQGLIDDEQIWLEMIEMRNLSSHIYDENEIREILDKLDVYSAAFSKLQKNLESRLHAESQ